MAKYEKLCNEILPLVGGRENIKSCFNCMTRLRFILADLSAADVEKLKAVDGVMGTQVVGNQLQVILGQKAGDVCKEFCALFNIAQESAVNDPAAAAADSKAAAKEKLSVKGIANNILNVMAGCIQPLLPVIICASMFRLVSSLIGPTILGLVTAESDLYRLLYYVGDVAFYFMPVLVGYTSAKHFDLPVPMGLIMGGVLLHPTLLDIVEAGESFTVFGIPMQLVDYSSSVVPVLLCVWIMSYVNRFFQKYLPDVLKFMLANFLTLLVMLPIGLCVLAPAGNMLATALAGIFIAIPQYLGGIGVGIVCFVWPLLVAFGMHLPVAMLEIATFLEVGHGDLCLVADNLQHYAAMGVALAFAVRALKKEDKELGVSSFVAIFLGGVIEPTLFGIALPNRKYLFALLAATGIAGVFAGFMNVGAYALSSSNIFGLLAFSGGTTQNLVCGLIAAAISFAGGFVISFALDWFTGKEKVKAA